MGSARGHASPRTMMILGAGALALATLGLAGPVSAQTGPVSGTPAAGTPQLASTGTTEQVRQLVKCGGTMYAVGRFTSISWNGRTYQRHNAFSFSASPPYTMSPWGPNVNGRVNSIALNARCRTAYLGGSFSSVGGKAAQNLAAVSTATARLITSFGHSANGQVETLLRTNGHLLSGGYYTKINGSTGSRYMTSLNPSTGKDDGFVRLNISGHYQFPGVVSNPTRVYNQQLSHGGTLETVEGDFTSVGGQPRQQVFMLNVGGSRASVTGWTGRGLNTNCNFNEPFYAQAAAWSPDDSTIYVATTGFKPNGTPGGSAPRTGPCDAAIAYPSTHTRVNHKWVNYTGCDSLYSTAADTSTAYFGGHERWSMNPQGCDFAGPGAISAPGMEGLSPGTGALTFNPTRGRGLGADDMLITSAGLWIASDNLQGTTQCGGVGGHAGICLLPYG
jgi:hypothetical protein